VEAFSSPPDLVLPFCVRVEVGLTANIKRFQRSAGAAEGEAGPADCAGGSGARPWEATVQDRAFIKGAAAATTPELEVLVGPVGVDGKTRPTRRMPPCCYNALVFNNISTSNCGGGGGSGGAAGGGAVGGGDGDADADSVFNQSNAAYVGEECRAPLAADPTAPYLSFGVLKDSAFAAVLGKGGKKKKDLELMASSLLADLDTSVPFVQAATVRTAEAARDFHVLVDGELQGPFRQIR
jgi:hypothetical protein